MIYVWSSAKAALIHDTVGKVFQKEGTPYKVCPLELPPPVADGDVVLAMGGRALEKLQAHGMAPKNFKVGAMRGKRLAGVKTKTTFFVTFDPTVALREPEHKGSIRWDARLAARVAKTGSTRPKTGKYTWASDLSGIVAKVEEKYAETGQPVPLALDLETEGLFPWYPEKRIVTSQWTVEPGQALVIDHYTGQHGPPGEKLLKQITFLMTSPKVRLWGANLKFDLQWIWRKWGVRTTNFTFDLLFAASLIDENRFNSLNSITKEYCPALGGYDDEFNATIDKGKMVQALAQDPNGFLTYSGGDSDATYQCSDVLRHMLAQDKQLTRFFQTILMPAGRAFEKIEDRGVLIDKKKYREVELKVVEAQKELAREAFTMIPKVIKAKYADNLALHRAPLLREIMFGALGFGLKPIAFCPKPDKNGIPVPSTSIDDHLSHFNAHPQAGPFVQAIGKLGKLKKLRSTYIGQRDASGEFTKGFLSHLRPDGRFHPTYMLYAGAIWEGKAKGDENKGGTNTGRLSAKGPAIQTLVKHGKWAKELRKAYIAPNGMVCWELDFSQGELRVAACLANELNMIAAYKKGVDIHAMTGAMIMGALLEEFLTWKAKDHPKHQKYVEGRQRAKPVNFGFLYGMGAEGFVKYAWKSYGVVFSLQEAEAVREGFFETYSGLLPWHKRQREWAQKHKYVRSPLGRVRHLPHIDAPDREIRSKADRQAINSPVQSCLSDLGLWLAALIDQSDIPEEEFHVVGQTHDSLNGYAREDVWQEHLATAADLANNLPIRDTFRWNHQIPFPVDAQCGPSLGEMDELVRAGEQEWKVAA